MAAQEVTRGVPLGEDPGGVGDLAPDVQVVVPGHPGGVARRRPVERPAPPAEALGVCSTSAVCTPLSFAGSTGVAHSAVPLRVGGGHADPQDMLADQFRAGGAGIRAPSGWSALRSLTGTALRSSANRR